MSFASVFSTIASTSNPKPHPPPTLNFTMAPKVTAAMKASAKRLMEGEVAKAPGLTLSPTPEPTAPAPTLSRDTDEVQSGATGHTTNPELTCRSDAKETALPTLSQSAPAAASEMPLQNTNTEESGLTCSPTAEVGDDAFPSDGDVHERVAWCMSHPLEGKEYLVTGFTSRERANFHLQIKRSGQMSEAVGRRVTRDAKIDALWTHLRTIQCGIK